MTVNRLIRLLLCWLDHVHTGVNFLDKVESCILIRFLRVTYVRLAGDESVECRLIYAAPSDFSYKTFTPPPVKVAMCSGSPEYEAFSATWERAKVWLSCVSKYHQLVQSLESCMVIAQASMNQVKPSNQLLIRCFYDSDYIVSACCLSRCQ